MEASVAGDLTVIDEPNRPIGDLAATPPPAPLAPDDEDGLSLPEDQGEAAPGIAPATPPPVESAPAEPAPATPPPVESAPAEPASVEPTPAKPIPAKRAPAKRTPAKPVAAQPAPVEPEPAASVVAKSDKMDWYILKVQSNREESIREGLRRKVKIEGKDFYFGDIIIPTEKVTEFKAGKRRVFKRKLYPGYLVVQMEINEETWFLVRETPGIGDFTGAAGHPTPMHAREVASIRAKQEEKADEAPKLKISFKAGDRVKIKEGTFENFEGEVASIDETNGRVTVLINIFGRSTPVDIEYWQIEAV
jgi:transcription termination/antitermination protein NusG